MGANLLGTETWQFRLVEFKPLPLDPFSGSTESTLTLTLMRLISLHKGLLADDLLCHIGQNPFRRLKT